MSPTPATAPQLESGPWWRPSGALWCLAVATLLTLVMAAPVLKAPKERLFGHEIVGRYHDAYTVLLWFERPTAPKVRTQPATDYLGAAVARAVGGVAALNFVLLWSFPLAAWFGYLFAFRVSRSTAASWPAALAFAFAPFHVAHAAYHPQVTQTQWMPFYLLALWLALERAGWRRLALLLAALGLVALSNFYGGLIALVMTPVVVAAAWLGEGRDAPDRFRSNLLRVTATFALVGAAGYAYLRFVATALLTRPESFVFPATDLARYTARWYSYLVPPVEHPILGARARAFWESVTLPGDLIEHQLTLGAGLLLLASIATGAWLRDRRRPALRPVPALLLLGATAFVFSLPPVWTIGGVSLNAPSGWLYSVAPMFRAHARFGLVVLLAVGVLAGIGFAALLGRRTRWSSITAFALLGLAAFELTPLPPFRWRDPLPTPAHRWLLARGGGTVKAVDCVSSAEPAEWGVPRLFGQGLFQLSPSADCSEPGLPGKLAALGFTHVIVRRDSRDGELLARRGPAPGVRVVQEFENAWLLAVEAPPAALYLELGSGFFLRQLHADRSYRWMGREAALKVVNRSSSVRTVTLRLTLHSMPFPRHVRYAFGSLAEAEAGVALNEPTSFALGPFAVPPGSTPLRLWSVEPATIADSVLHNGDQRAMALGLWEWELEETEVSPPVPELSRRRAGPLSPPDRPSGAAAAARDGAR